MAMRATVMRVAALQLQLQTPQSMATLRAASFPQSTAQTRSMGVLSNIKNTVSGKLEERNQHKQEEAYKQQMIDLSQLDKFDLNGFYDHLKVDIKNAEASGASGWRSMIPGVSSMTAVQQMKAFMGILDSMEIRDTEDGCFVFTTFVLQSPEEINNMLRNYEQLSALHIWLVKRVERGLSIPESMDETTELVRQDPTGFPAKKFRMKQRRY
ncbi:hypothetical protein PHMEG_0007186 [Phytophthora megakarya]|uniref:Uncharacterized protein n=1 Tax=Phytophthora megakarya TaxID=4795 RepID=A0A225WNL9_9STRA|nr:hypothetical protein PHMEG_0007186 [Phytophthora megakarya]